MATGTIYLRPCADISVEHMIYPANSGLSAYQHINEEVSDEDALYIKVDTYDDDDVATSKFKLSNATSPSNKTFIITGVDIGGDPTGASSAGDARNAFKLEINGTETETFLVESEKNALISVSVPDVIVALNEYVAINGTLPDINIIITSYRYTSTSDGGNKAQTVDSGVSQIYVAIHYEEITDIGIHRKVNGAWVPATAAYQKVNGAWVEITADELRNYTQNNLIIDNGVLT